MNLSDSATSDKGDVPIEWADGTDGPIPLRVDTSSWEPAEIFDNIRNTVLEKVKGPRSRGLVKQMRLAGYDRLSRVFTVLLPPGVYCTPELRKRFWTAGREHGFYDENIWLLSNGGGLVAPKWDLSTPNITTEDASGLVTHTLENVKQRRVEWMWKNKIPYGSVTVLAGDAGLGKSTIACDLIAKVTAKGKEALLIADEDGEEDTITPRLSVAGASLSLVHHLDGVDLGRKGGDPDYFEILRDIPRLADMLRQHSQLKLIVIDPWLNYIGNKNAYSAQEVRQVLMPLQGLAREFSIVILCIAHFRKSSADKPNDKVGGSAAVIQVPRSVLLVAETKREGDVLHGELHQTKHNLNPKSRGTKYTIVSARSKAKIDTSRVEWGGESEREFETLIVARDPADRQIDLCAEWLTGFLNDSEMPATEILTRGARKGFPQATVYRAKALLKVESRKDMKQNGRSFWSLPGRGSGEE
jgi:hypothetical protein